MPDMIKGLFFLILLMFFDLSHEVVWAALSRPLKPFGLHAPDLPCVREGGFEAVCRMPKRRKGRFPYPA